MKKQTLCSIFSRIFLLVVMAAGHPAIASAQTATVQDQSDSISLNEPVIRYLGADASFYYLQVQLDNPSMSRMHIELKDLSTGSPIFETLFADRYFWQTLPVPRTSLRLQWLVNCRPVKDHTVELLAIW
jgi:hypothetical protein